MSSELTGGLCRLLEAHTGGVTDAELVERFALAGDEAAFAALVGRHGGMVLGLCRRLIPDAHDAEDAFQATFLVLARKAGSLRARDVVGCWLYGVARRVAGKARTLAARRRGREQPLEDVPDPASPVPVTDPGLAAVIDEEVGRLPPRYREPVVLCCLGGESHEQAARQLGCPVGTVKSRLSRGRELLRRRLTRRGLAPAVAGLAVFLESTARAAVPVPLAVAVVRMAVLVEPNAPAAALAERVVREMTRIRLTSVVLLLLVASGLGLGLATLGAWTAPAPVVDGKLRGTAADDPLPPGAIARLGSSRLRHTWYVNGVSFSADSKLLASSGTEYHSYHTVRIWEMPSGREVRTIRPRATGAVEGLVLSLDGKLVAWTNRGADGVTVADVDTGRELERLHRTGKKGTAPSFAFSPDGKSLATAGNDSTVRLWDLSTGQETLRAEVKSVDRCFFSPDGRVLAVLGGGFAGLRLIDVGPGRKTTGKLLPFPAVRPAPHAVAFSPDGELLAGADDNLVRLWNVSNGKEVRRLAWEGRKAYAVGFARDGRTLAAAAADGTVSVWAVATGRQQREFTLPFKLPELPPALAQRGGRQMPPGNLLAFAPNLRWLAATPGGKAIRLADMLAGKEVAPFAEQPEVNSLTCAYSPDSKLLATPGSDNRLLLWQARTGRLLRTVAQTPGKVFWLTFTPDGKGILTICYERPTALPTLTEWDVATGKQQRQAGVKMWPGAVALSPDGRLLAWGEPNDVRYRSDLKSKAETVLIDRATGKEVRRLDDQKVYAPQDLTFSPDSATLASVAPDGTIRLWEAATGKLLRRMQTGGHEGLYYRLRFLPDGRTLLSLSMNYDRGGHIQSRLIEWDVATGQRRSERAGPADVYWCLALSPDGKFLAWGGKPWAGSPDDRVELWDIAAGRVRRLFRGLPSGPNMLRFSPDGKTLASGSNDDTILIWDVAGGKNR